MQILAYQIVFHAVPGVDPCVLCGVLRSVLGVDLFAIAELVSGSAEKLNVRFASFLVFDEPFRARLLALIVALWLSVPSAQPS